MRGQHSVTAEDGKRSTPRRSAYDKALAMLARREHSCRELRTRLARSSYPADEIETALASLIEANYQSDERFAEMLVRSRIRQGYGPARLRAELRTHELPDGWSDKLIAQAEADWAAQARGQLQRRYGDTAPRDYRERAKRMQFLVRRGFDGATAYSVVETVMPDDPE